METITRLFQHVRQMFKPKDRIYPDIDLDVYNSLIFQWNEIFDEDPTDLASNIDRKFLETTGVKRQRRRVGQHEDKYIVVDPDKMFIWKMSRLDL